MKYQGFLELENITEQIQPHSQYGKALLKKQPFYKRGEEDILEAHYKRLAELEALWDKAEKAHTLRYLSELKNIALSLEKLQGGVLPSVVDFFEIKRFCYFFIRVLNSLEEVEGIKALYRLDFRHEIWRLLDPSDSGQFYFSIDSDYAHELRKELEHFRDLEKAEITKVCSKLESSYNLSLKNRTEFMLERSDIRNHALRKSKNLMIVSESPFSITYRVIKSDDERDYSQQLERIETQLEAEAQRYSKELASELSIHVDFFRQQMSNISEFDRDIALLAYKKNYNACFPKIEKGAVNMKVSNGVNHHIADFCNKRLFDYDPLSVELKEGVCVIVGANMGGKTTALKTLGQMYLAFAKGFPVSAVEFTSCLFDSVNCVFRDREQEGLSGFAVEVKRILPVFQEGIFLNLIDEFGAATNPKEGDALASSVVLKLSEMKSVSVFVTHFSGPLSYSSENYQTGFLKAHEGVILDEENIYRFLDHSLKKIQGQDIPRAAITISKALGMPQQITDNAERIYKNNI